MREGKGHGWTPQLTQGFLGEGWKQTLTPQCLANFCSEKKQVSEALGRACEGLSFPKVKQTALWFLAHPCNSALPGVNMLSILFVLTNGLIIVVSHRMVLLKRAYRIEGKKKTKTKTEFNWNQWNLDSLKSVFLISLSLSWMIVYYIICLASYLWAFPLPWCMLILFLILWTLSVSDTWEYEQLCCLYSLNSRVYF